MSSSIFTDIKAAACVVLVAVGLAVAGTSFFEAVFSAPSVEAQQIIQAGKVMAGMGR